MLGEIRPYTQEQFASLLERPWNRKITEVHIHHTWRPTHADWRGAGTVKAMRDYHVKTNGWSDIAQHLTVGADGSLWMGRHLDRPPASATGHNGNSREGPLMIEIVGDFDRGRNPFVEAGSDGRLRPTPQADAVYEAVASICAAFGLAADRIFFHRDFTGAKTCPGTSVEREPFRAEVDRRLKARGAKPRGTARTAGAAGAATPQAIAAERYLMQFGAAPDTTRDATDEGEPAYDDAQALASRDIAAEAPGARDFGGADIELFRRHVINLQMGRLSDGGEFSTSEADVDALLDHLSAWLKLHAAQPGRIVFFAHGGLVSERTALRKIVLRDVHWWLANDVYPVFFVWETGIDEVFEDLREEQERAAARGLADVWDKGLEKTLGPLIGRPTWRRIKNNALLSSNAFPNADPGGAKLFAGKLAARLAKLSAGSAPVAAGLHAVGHSAGAIFHCHFIPALNAALKAELSAKAPRIDTLALLAPAARVDLFKQLLAPEVVAGTIGSCAVFTMNRGAEEDDNVAGVYRKSLLYFVRNACEDGGTPPILGLEESIRADADLVKLFGLGGKAGAAEVIWSPTGADAHPRRAARATAHGAFDDDGPCMNSVLRRILDLSDNAALPLPNLGAAREGPLVAVPAAAPARPAPAAAPTGTGQRLALCIGIDEYRTRPLQGCLADARDWGGWLKASGFAVDYLINGQATRRAILESMASTLDRSRAGDVVVIQFAGHGTQVEDVSGDERASDGLDEAWVPYDYEDGEFVIDDEIGGLFDRYRARGIELVLFTDCCHSGSSTRAAFRPGDPQLGPQSRYLPVPRELNARFAAKQRGQRATGRADDDVRWEIHFAACQDDESAYEENGHGKFTVAAMRTLAAAGAQHTYGALADSLREAFHGDSRQTPKAWVRAEQRARALFAAGAHSVAASAAAAPAHPAPGAGASFELVIQRLDGIERRVDEISTRTS